jgi:hypothetical protein
VGDALGMTAFDADERGDLLVPALSSRGIGSVMADMLERCETAAAGSRGWSERRRGWRRAQG